MRRPGFESWDMRKLELSSTRTKTPALLDFQAAGLITDSVRDCLKGIRWGWRSRTPDLWPCRHLHMYTNHRESQAHTRKNWEWRQGGTEGRRDGRTEGRTDGGGESKPMIFISNLKSVTLTKHRIMKRIYKAKHDYLKIYIISQVSVPLGIL